VLTPRQRECLELSARGFKAHAIAWQLGITSHGVASCLNRSYRALKVSCLPAAVAKAIALGEIANPWERRRMA
jgi:DNA-binding NarL/FixJ family response regulator